MEGTTRDDHGALDTTAATPRNLAEQPAPADLPVHVRAMRFFDRHVWAFDSLFIALPLTLLEGLIASNLYLTSPRDQTVSPGSPMFDLVRFAVVVAICALLALRRMWAVPIACAVAGLALVSVVTMTSPDLHYLAVPITVYTVAAYDRQRWGLVFLWAGYVGALLVGGLVAVNSWDTLRATDDPQTRNSTVLIIGVIVVLCAAIVTVAWLLGDLRRRKRVQAVAIRERSALLERERAHEARLAADAERLRIARELHDVVSHSMSVMIAQADGGRFIASQAPQRVPEVFGTISDTGRSALAQMRRMLGVLREPGEQQSKAPMPDVADLPQLVTDVRAAGLHVDLIGNVSDLPALPPGAGLAVYRTVQEALTNTLKHAGRESHATVRVQYGRIDGCVYVRVDDSGPATAEGAQASATTETWGQSSPPSGDGHGSGLRGMRERAALYGGSVVTGQDAAGFHILLTMPLAPPDESEHAEPQRTA